MIAILSLSVQGESKRVILAYGNYAPYYGKEMEDKGPLSEIVVKAFAESGYQTKLVNIPVWKRQLTEVEKGNYDGLFSLWYRKEREQWFLFSDTLPIPPSTLGFYKHKDSDYSFESYGDLIGLRIGVVRGYSYPHEFNEKHFILDEAVRVEHNIAKLLKKRIDLALIDKNVGMEILTKEHPDHVNELEWIEPPVGFINQHLAISKKTKHAQQKVDAFNAGLKSLYEKGEVSKILKKFGLSDN
ncbi:substrate-binding periplasmic protein [Flocculibacter collagenilyticus]|uniref:substrate-binding periplasmic protein n=1 Tax=Flocculibacter collagenilyticus TaxID=2744479 RepID=UPI0018F72085|nr:transporter substrate-binding domain-containing protein [Flocculibacter collagenilyticus]